MPARSESFDQGNLSGVTIAETTESLRFDRLKDSMGDNNAPEPLSDSDVTYDSNASSSMDVVPATMSSVPAERIAAGSVQGGFRPVHRMLQLKTRSASAIESIARPPPASFPGDDKVLEIIDSFQKIKTTGTNHFRTTDLLEQDPKFDKKNIVDSHTSYRKSLEAEITELKVKLAVAQERADTLQNEYNRVSAENGTYHARMDDIIEKYDSSKKHSEELSAVVSHLQENAKEASDGRRIMQEKVQRFSSECKALTKKCKQLRHENRRLKKELKETGHDLEGRGMENQGLKSENDWLKQQLQNNRDGGLGQEDVSDLGESSDDEKVVTGIRELLSFPGSSKRTPGRRRAQRGKSTRTNVEVDSFQDIESLESRSESRSDEQDNAPLPVSVPSQPVGRGFLTPLRPQSFRLPTVSSAPPAQPQDKNSSTPQLLGIIERHQKSAAKWNIWNTFAVGSNHEYISDDNGGDKKSESEHSSGDFVQFPPPGESQSRSINIISQKSPFADLSKSKLLVPKRLNERIL